jgi:hypothetical protein
LSEVGSSEVGSLEVGSLEVGSPAVARWEFHQRGLAVHRRIAAEHQDALKKLGREYPAAVQHEQKRWDEAHAKELAAEPSTNGHHADDVALPEV